MSSLDSNLKVTSKEVNRTLKEIQNGNTSSLKLFLQNYNDHWSTICYDKTGDTILHCAARLGLIDVIEYLLTTFHPKAVDCRNKDDKTALHEAAQFAQFDACKKLIEHGSNVNALKRADWTPLMLACTKINIEHDGEARIQTVQLLLEKGGLVNYRNKDGWTSLHLICREGDSRVLNMLIKSGVNLKLKTKNGRSALHIAALHGNYEVIDILLNSGLNVNEKDNCGNIPLHEAVLGGYIDICEKLIEHGADITLKNNTDYGLIHLASLVGNVVSLKYLLNVLKCDINEINTNGITALHCSARKGQKEIYDFLIDNGAQENIRDIFNRTASDYFQ